MRYTKRKIKDDEPIISIITPFFNAEEYIEETAKSVLSQTFSNFEWIIVDDGSSKEAKGKLNEIEKLDKRIKVFSYSNEPKGPAQARDFGIRNSAKSAKYIVYILIQSILEQVIFYGENGMMQSGN